MGVGDELERLADLHDRGVIDDDEFTAAKRRLLGIPVAPPSPNGSPARAAPPPPTAGRVAAPPSAAWPPPPPDAGVAPAPPRMVDRLGVARPAGLRLLGTWTQSLVWVTSALFAASALVGAGAWATYEASLSGGRSVADSVAADDAYWTVLGIAFITMIAPAVLVVTWLFRHHKQVAAASERAPRYRRGWTIGGWLVPIANLWIPKQVVDDVWRLSAPDAHHDASDAPRPHVPARHHWWWGLWLVGGVVNQVAGTLEPSDPAGWRTLYATAVSGDVLWAAAGLLLGLIVRDVTRRTYERVAPPS